MIRAVYMVYWHRRRRHRLKLVVMAPNAFARHFTEVTGATFPRILSKYETDFVVELKRTSTEHPNPYTTIWQMIVRYGQVQLEVEEINPSPSEAPSV